jgi:hypothetical protein
LKRIGNVDPSGEFFSFVPLAGTSTWVVVSKLANPQWVVEMETVAAKA